MASATPRNSEREIEEARHPRLGNLAAGAECVRGRFDQSVIPLEMLCERLQLKYGRTVRRVTYDSFQKVESPR
jgi:hypothetical protein